MMSRVLALILIFSCATLNALTTNPQNKTVLITGGLSGVGRDIAMEFKQAGWNVWATSRTPQNREAISGIHIRQLDLTNEAEIKKLLQEIKSTNKHLDVLVNNAAYRIMGHTETISVNQAREVMEVNVIGPFLLIQEALPIMRSNQGGHIINISSTQGLRAEPGFGIYSASKMALEGLSEALAAEVAPWNIKVVLIEPEAIKTDWVQNIVTPEKLSNYPGYKTFTNKLQQRQVSKNESAQSSKEVAQLTMKVATDPKPNLRYQTNSTVTALAQEILVDPTGNKMRDQTIKMSNDLYNSKF